MLTSYNWAIITYTEFYKLKKDKPKERKKVACFSGLCRVYGALDYLEMFDSKHKKTVKYRDWFLQYIADMLALEDVTITEKSFKFKAYKNHTKNMFVLSIVRILWEKMGNVPSKDCTNHEFLEALKNGKCRYRNKLARFCYFYKHTKIKCKYFHEGHIWAPSKTVIRYTKDFQEKKKLSTVNSFFYGK